MLQSDGKPAGEQPLYPPFPSPPPQPLGLISYFLNFVRNPLSVMPAVVYREPIFQYRGGRITYVTDPALVKRILLDEFDDFPKTPVELHVFSGLLGSGLLTTHGAEWRWQRQAAAPIFRHAEILRYAPVMAAAADAVVAKWRTQIPGTVRRVDDDTTRATFSVIAETMLHSDDRAVTAALERSNRDYLLPMSWPAAYGMLGLPQGLPYPRRAIRRDAERDMRRSVANLVKERRLQPETREDLMTRLLAAKDPDSCQSMSDERMVDNLLTFLLAGHETTAKSLAWMLYLVARSPEWESRLLEEITAVAGRDPIEAAHVERLTATAMFIKEAMRLYPPISSLVRVATKDVDFAGTPVRAGSIIVIPIFAIHRHSLLWDDPHRFNPFRFTPEGEARQVRYQYMPFGAGPRICIGASFATLEATIMLAIFVRAARFEVPAGHVPEPSSRVALQPKNGMPLFISMREPRAAST